MNAFYIILICIASAIAAALLLLLIGSYITYRMTFYRSEKSKLIDPREGLEKEGYREFREVSEALIDGILKRECEFVYIKSHDGLKLRARYYHVNDSFPLAIQCHGYKSSPMRDFSGGGVMAMELGFNVLMIDQRAHEGSEGHTISFGLYEAQDVLSWIKYSIERFGKDIKIMLHGMSMGAATVLTTSALDLPSNVIGAVADCSYSSAEAIIRRTISGMGLPHRPLYPLVRLGGRLWGGFDPSSVNVALSASAHKIPLLLIHGEGDSFVPCDMAREIYLPLKDDPAVSLNTFPNAEHGISWLHDTERYYTLVREFSQKALNGRFRQ